ncbi:MAG: alpha/beta hydrolase [Asticcacaulis sp.]
MSDDNDDALPTWWPKASPTRSAWPSSAIPMAVSPPSPPVSGPTAPINAPLPEQGVSSLERIGNLWGDSHIQRDIQGRTVAGMDPLKNVANANIPIMLFHGDHDRQADTDHSRMFYAAMKAAGKDVQYTEIKGMWHTIPWHVEWQQQSLGLIEDFLKSPKCGLIQ